MQASLRFIRAPAGYYRRPERFSNIRASLMVDFHDFHTSKLGREVPEPGRGAPVRHAAAFVGPTCMLVAGDGL